MMQNEYADPVGKNTVLNPKIWDHDNLKPEVRGALLRMAEDFLEFVEVPVDVKDIIITGGNVNYTYTKDSDIDLHIVADFDSVKCERETAELFDSKRLLYKRQYQLDVYGIPVELYIEDHRTPGVTAGMYSIVQEKWLRKPNRVVPKFNSSELAHWLTVWTKILQRATMTGDLQTCRTALKLLRTYRKRGLATSAGEFSIPNLVYKSLRNDQVIDGMVRLIDRLHDQELSI
jgi:predicted nucleotidyltransferase